MNAVIDPRSSGLPDLMTPWNDRTQTLEVIDIFDEAPDVKTFCFRSDERTWFRYKAGQFITLELPCKPEPLMRTYTLSSSPSRPFAISVTVKAQAGSVGTRWMFDNLRAGMRIRAHGPAGVFSHHDHAAERYLFISAGSGITPMMSMLRWMSDCAPATDTVFINCARRPDEIIFRRELELLAGRMPGLSLGFLVEGRIARDAWLGHTGRIDAARLQLLAPDFDRREIFCCGPEPFMRSVRAILEAASFDMRRYHQESFGISPPQPSDEATPPVGKAGAADESHPIRFAASGVSASCHSGQTILQAARAAGVRIAAACESGICGTCKVAKVSGVVAMDHQGGILDEEIADGFILACCSRPLGEVEIEA